jgi:hypothetical protein
MDNIRELMDKVKNMSETRLKIKNDIYDLHKTPDGQKIFVGETGILGNDGKLIDWNTIKELMNKYNK